MNVQCPSCSAVIAAEAEDFGSAMQCGRCGGVVEIPIAHGSPGVVIGKDFIIRSLLGKGGAGSVYLAYQISLDREVALKLLHLKFAGDPERVGEFVREARTAAKLQHPNIVRALAVGTEPTPSGPMYYIAMELVRGESVMDILRRSQRLPFREALRIGREAAVGLAHAWDTQQLLHRDIKPDNLMICDDGSVKLADLGLAAHIADMDLESDRIDGTPPYICPEYVVGRPMDVRGDIYSLGATLYHMLTGQIVFSGEPAAILDSHVNDPVVPPAALQPDVPEAVSAMICRMLDKDPANRYAHPNDLVGAIDDYLKKLDSGAEADSAAPAGAKRKPVRRTPTSVPAEPAGPAAGALGTKRSAGSSPAAGMAPAVVHSDKKKAAIIILSGLAALLLLILLATLASRHRNGADIAVTPTAQVPVTAPPATAKAAGIAQSAPAAPPSVTASVVTAADPAPAAELPPPIEPNKTLTEQPQWIWHSAPLADPKHDKAELRCTLVLSSAPRNAVLFACGDNAFTTRINGKPAASSNNWKQPVAVDASPYLKAGENLIEVDAEMFGDAYGFVARLEIGSGRYKKAYTTSAGWQARQPDGSWLPARVIAVHGSQPWGPILGKAPRPAGAP